jgi:hypothetical protein
MSQPIFIASIGEIDPVKDLEDAIEFWKKNEASNLSDQIYQIVADYARHLLEIYLKTGDTFSSLETSIINCKFVINKKTI